MNRTLQHHAHVLSCLRAVFTALFAFAASALAVQEGKSPVKIFIMIGQSNMLGHGNISPATTKGTLEYVVAKDNDPGGDYQFVVDSQGDWVVRDDVWIKDQYGNASGLTAGYGSGATVPTSNLPPYGSNIGPELGFGHAMGAFYEEQILIVKAAWGGKSLGNDFLPPSSGPYPAPTADGDTGFYYAEVLRLVDDAIDNLHTYFPGYNAAGGYEIAGICWHQGWNDRVSGDFSDDYETNMANFIRDIRSDLGVPDLPFVIATSAMDGNGPATYTQVELAQRAMTDLSLSTADPPDPYSDFIGSVAVVDCRQTYNGWYHTGLQFWQDVANSPVSQGYHWNRNAKTYLNIGLAMADEMATLAPSLCPSRLQASASATSGVELDWLNWDNIPTSVQILRDGVEVAAALPGSTTIFADTGADPGVIDYELVFTMPGDPCAPLTVTFDGSITGLEAVRSAGGVTLTWRNAMVYPGIKVLRNGVIIEPNLTGTSESFIDTSPFPTGSVIYQVEPTTGTSTPAQARLKPHWEGGSTDIATDGDGVSGGGSGTWDTTTLNWDEGAAPHVAWNNTSNSTAIFGGTVGMVTIATGGITAAGLEITGGYTFDGDPLTLTSTASIANDSTVNFYPEIISSAGLTKTGIGELRLRNNNSFTGDIVIGGGKLRIGENNNTGSLGGGSFSGNITIAAGAQLWDTSNSSQILSGVISGGGGINKGGSGIMTLTGNNTFTGKTQILGSGAGGPGLSISSFNSVDIDDLDPNLPMPGSSLGRPTTVANGTIELGSTGNQRSSTLYYTGAGETTDRVMKVGFNSGSDQTIYANITGGGLLKFTSPFVIARSSGSQGASMILRGTGNGEIAGGTSGDVIPGFLQKTDGGTWTLGGTTTVDDLIVSGGTLDIDGTLDAVTSAPIPGTGYVTVSGGTLTVDGLLTFVTTTTISGGTLDGTGSLSFDIDGTSSDLVTMTSGALSATGLTIAIVPGGSGLTQSEYILVDATGGGTFTGPFAGVTGAPGYELNYDTPNQVKLVLSGGVTYASWAGTFGGLSDPTASLDFDKGGLSTGIEWVVDGDPTDSSDDAGFAPVLDNTTDPDFLIFTYRRSDDAFADANTSIEVEYGSDLSGWTTAVAGPDILINATDDGAAVGVDLVTVKIRRSAFAVDGKLFARLNVVVTP